MSKIDSFTVKQGVVTNPIGDLRDAQVEHGKLNFPDLTVSVAESSSDSWFIWFEAS